VGKRNLFVKNDLGQETAGFAPAKEALGKNAGCFVGFIYRRPRATYKAPFVLSTGYPQQRRAYRPPLVADYNTSALRKIRILRRRKCL